MVCASNLRQMGLALAMYADEEDEYFPSVQGWDCWGKSTGSMMFRGHAMFPEYLTDVRILLCPSNLLAKESVANGAWWIEDANTRPGDQPSIDPCALTALAYTYVPWLIRPEWVTDDATLDFDNNFYEGLLGGIVKAAMEQGPTPSWEFEDEHAELHRVLAARDGVARFMITDVNAPAFGSVSEASMPIMFDLVTIIPSKFNHLPGGTNVLYMDGHVEYSRYPQQGPYPASRAWAMALSLFYGQDPYWYKNFSP